MNRDTTTGQTTADGIHSRSTAIVTGAAGGMGSQCARLLTRDGWRRLLLCDLDAARLEVIAGPLRAEGAQVSILADDIADHRFPTRLLKQLGDQALGAFIHAAGVAPQTTTIARIFEINLDASLRLLAAVGPRIAQGGVALLFASIAAYLPVTPEAEAAFENPIAPEGSASLRHFAADQNQAYLLSKRAIMATVKREARAFGERGVRIVSVSPGLIDTAMTRGVENDLTRALLGKAAIARMGRSEEVAEACVFLCSPAASFITGCDLRVDGGELAGIGI
jgi:NAD(P)-dependent dehydrogenase (short-subunit alcohol dehydrogenase family)